MAAKTAALARASMAKASITPSTSPMPHKRPVARKPAEEKTDQKMCAEGNDGAGAKGAGREARSGLLAELRTARIAKFQWVKGVGSYGIHFANRRSQYNL
jgi:hypothetical protein